MAAEIIPTLRNLDRKSVTKKMFIGWIIGLAVISSFVFFVDDPDPAWGEYWQVRPLIITPLAAAFGSLAFFLKDVIKPQSDVMRLVVFLVSTLGFIVALWLGVILGLDGTLWD